LVSTFELQQEINSQKNRFTQPESSQKIEYLLAKLKPIILEFHQEEEQEKEKHLQDKQIILKLRQKTPTSLKTIIECEEGIKDLDNLRLQLNYPERFNTEINQLRDNLNQYLYDSKNELSELEISIKNINDNRKLDKIQKDLAKLEIIFENSPEYLICQNLVQDINNLRNLFNLTQNLKDETIKDYQNLLEKLTEWYELLENKSDNLAHQYQIHHKKIEDKIISIRQIEQEKTTKWFNQIEEDFKKLNQEIGEQKLDYANNLIAKIDSTIKTYEDYLTEEEKHLVEQIKLQCIDIQNESKENQIIVLFQQLAPEYKQLLYRKLEKYL
jgi:hypothetical protein